MALKIKMTCEKCAQPLTADGEAYVCSYECTFCPECTEKLNAICPNCGGELMRRPRREEKL